MASHGAAVGLLIGLWLFSRKNKLPYIWSLDRIMVPVAIGGAIVRLGNLFNSEIVGAVTDVSWGVKFVRVIRMFLSTPSPCNIRPSFTKRSATW